mmetsp:Transcript_12754/g.1918  ORF Transcript_12754/g.1918 Transcript_12754/m.1918 type:complete len:83 (-) Transcript_12754:172-420(-)
MDDYQVRILSNLLTSKGRTTLVSMNPKENNGGLKGILRKPNQPKKKVSIRFDVEPYEVEIFETDFQPGRRVAGAAKDATPIK